MPLYQVKTLEKVYVARFYEIEAPDAMTARRFIAKSLGSSGELIDEQIQDTYSFDCVLEVTDKNGNKVARSSW